MAGGVDRKMPMRQALETISHTTRGKGLYELTEDVTRWLERQGFGDGLVTVFCRHTSASLCITENASPAVRRDIGRFLDDLAPEDARYEHDEEGIDDMPAHLRALVTQASLSIPMRRGSLVLGTWQGIFLAEHRTRAHRREIVVHALGE